MTEQVLSQYGRVCCISFKPTNIIDLYVSIIATPFYKLIFTDLDWSFTAYCIFHYDPCCYNVWTSWNENGDSHKLLQLHRSDEFSCYLL